jgi:TnpA family transposase
MRHALLPADPDDEELSRAWNLSEEDLVEVYRCRGDDKRFSFALQLCTLRRYGRFLGDDYDSVPVRIANHVGHQLGLPPVLIAVPPAREATDLGHERRIRDYLKFKGLDAEHRKLLERHLRDLAKDGLLPTELYERAEGFLRARLIILPGRVRLERFVAGVLVRAEADVHDQIRQRLTPEFCAAIDAFLEVRETERRSPLAGFKQYPPEATPAALLEYLERERLLRSIGTASIDLQGLRSELVKHLGDFVDRYDVDDLKRFAPTKRHAMVACFLLEAHRTILDHIVEMHRQFVTGMRRRARHAAEQHQREIQQRAQDGLSTMLRTVERLLESARERDHSAGAVVEEFGEAVLRDALQRCRELEQIGDRGLFDELLARHAHLKRYLPGFLELPFEGQPGTESLLAAVDIARQLHRGELRELPASAVEFASGAWRTCLAKRLDRRLWEIALAVAMCDALRSGDLYLADSRHHVSFWNLVYDAERWERERAKAYSDLDLTSDADRALHQLRLDFHEAAKAFSDGLGSNRFAAIEGSRLVLSRRDALDVPNQVLELRRMIETRLPRIRIEDLLVEVDSWCHFSGELVPLGDQRPRSENPYALLLAALVAHGTNLGIATMAQSTNGISVDALHHVSRWSLRPETLKAANRVLVDHHHGLPLASTWGEGTASSSDGQRFGIQASSLLASFYPRYFGYYDRAVSVYTHVSDQFSAFSSRVISCAPREAIYVLDGLLENDTVLRPREHYTDTHGFTEQLFGLCHLLGFSFMPRLKDLKDQQLYRPDRESLGALDSIIDATADTALIREQWDQLVRVAASLKNHTAPAHLVLERLAASPRSDRLAKALTALGRNVKTAYILRYLHDPAVRDRVQLQLNRGESRHELARRLFFANQGAFRTGDYEEIMNKVSALALLSNAVLAWNTVRIGEIVASIEATGQPVLREHLARVSPLLHAHVIPSGTYHFDRAVSAPHPNG